MNYKNLLIVTLLSIFVIPGLALAVVNTGAPKNTPPPKIQGWNPMEQENQVSTTTDNGDNPEEETMTPEQLQQRAQLYGLEKAAEVQNRIQVRREERVGILAEARLRRIEAYGQRIIDRNEAAIERIESFISRLEKRLDLLEDVNPNIDTTASREALAEAKTILEEARQEMDEAIDKIVDLLENEEPQDIFALVKESVNSLAQKIRQAHAKVVEAISLLKAQPIEEVEDETDDDTEEEDETENE